MINKENNYYIKDIKSKLKEKILVFLRENSENEIIIDDLINFYSEIILSKEISDYNKISFFNLFMQTGKDYFKDYLLNIISNSILKIYNLEKKIDVNLLINSKYFLFKFLSSKEILKDILNKYIYLISINNHFLVQNPNLSLLYKQIISSFYKDEIKINNYLKKYLIDCNSLLNNSLDIDSYLNESGYSFLNIYFDFIKNILKEKSYEIIEIINDKSFFYFNEKNELDISNDFKNFLSLTMGFIVTDHILSLETDDFDLIKSEFDKKIIYYEIF